MADLRFIEATADPTLIPGVYNTCDQWCNYCPVTSRCLAFRCIPASGELRDMYETLAEAMEASMKYLKECYDAEGLKPPEELLRLLADDPRRHAAFEPLNDPLERMGRHYAVLANAYLASVEEIPAAFPKRPGGPTPFEVFLYYHVRIAGKIARAIMSSSEAARTGRPWARWDADASAKVALVSIDRSDQALQVMTLDDPDPRIEHMRRHLRRLGREVEARFPAARTLVRPGLDDSGAGDGRCVRA